MKTVITFSLRGRAFQVEEDGHRRLRQYLDSLDTLDPAFRSVAEETLAEKLAACVDASKTVVTGVEVDGVLRGMPSATGTRAPDTAPPVDGRRKLYRIRDGQKIAGLCLGLSVYAKIDVDIVRTLFILFSILTGGLFIVLYVIAMFIVPVVDTVAQTEDPLVTR